MTASIHSQVLAMALFNQDDPEDMDSDEEAEDDALIEGLTTSDLLNPARKRVKYDNSLYRD